MIRFTAVTKRFAGRVAVGGLTVDMKPGEVTALLGPNGSGKTTTLKMAAGLIRPDEGTVTVGGAPAWEPAARTRLAFLPQRVAFPESLTGREVLEFYRALRGAPADSVEAGLRIASLNGAGTRAVGTYSGGMVQRLGLAVATLPGAGALLLDEPTAALDPEGLAAFYDLVRRGGSERTVLFTSHQVADVQRVADRVLVLAAGALVADLPRAALDEWRDAHGTLRLVVRNAEAALPAILRAMPAAQLNGNTVVVPAQAASRIAVLDAIRRSGAIVETFVAEPATLEALYAELLRPAPGDGTVGS